MGDTGKRCTLLLLLLVVVSVAAADGSSDCDILVGRLNGPDPGAYPVSEIVFGWLKTVAEDSCGLAVEFYQDVVTDDDFSTFNEAAIERNASAMLIGSYGIEADSVLLHLVPEQIYTNPYLLVDREHLSRPDEPMVFCTGLLESPSSPPEFARFYGFLMAALAHNRQGRNQTALAEVNRALEITSGVPPEALAMAYLLRSQVLMVITSDYSAGMADIENALELDPDNIRAKLSKGYQYELAGDPQSALDQYTLAIEMDPTLYKPYKLRANLFSNLGMFEESIPDYNMAVELNPGDFESWHYGGVDYRRTRDFTRSYEWLTMALELEPEAAQVWYDRSLVNAISEIDLDSSLEDLAMALELDSTLWRWYNTAATIAIVMDEWHGCIEMATLGLEVSPEEPQLLLTRSTGHMMLQDIESALTDVEVAVEQAGYRSDVNLRGSTYTILGTLQSLYDMEPGSATYWLYLGFAYSEGGYFEEAIEPYTRAILMNRSLLDAYYLRGLCWVEIGITEQAVADLQKVLEMTEDTAGREVIQDLIDQLGE